MIIIIIDYDKFKNNSNMHEWINIKNDKINDK